MLPRMRVRSSTRQQKKKYRILLMVHETFVPPVETGIGAARLDEIRTEVDVLRTLRRLGHEVIVVGIGGDLAELRETIDKWRPHVVFNLLDEFAGIISYDTHVVAYLELLEQRYTGCNPRGMMLSRDKVLTKRVLATHGITTPAFKLFPFGRRFHAPARVRFPLFVKSATEDASLGIAQASLCEDMRSLRERVELIHDQVQSDALVEEYIDGRELYVGVLGNAKLVTLPPWEMDFGALPRDQARIATRRAKWNRRYQAKHGIDTGKARLRDDQHAHLSRLSKRIYRALYMTGFARMDFRLCSDGRLFLLEANCNPNLSKGEDFADSAKAAGIGYTALVDRILQLGLASMPEWRQHAPRARTVRQNVKSTPIT
ncbi:MAG TPA: D-alanine--D-alanine ligase [Gammaproteobacteria bacterium]|nr:D-alanine--D-alanine ligase [Gammaproteobacteria bacterium]